MWRIDAADGTQERFTTEANFWTVLDGTGANPLRYDANNFDPDADVIWA